MGYSGVHLCLMSSAETLDPAHTALHGPGLPVFLIQDTGKVVQNQSDLNSGHDATFQLRALLFPFITVSPLSHFWNSVSALGLLRRLLKAYMLP